jgi:hypothetical protein
MYLGQQFLALGSKPLKGIVVRVVHIKPTITLSTVLPPVARARGRTLIVSFGQAQLGFAVPKSQLRGLAQALMTLSADEGSRQ